MFHSQALKISTTEDDGTEILVNGLEKRLGGGKLGMGSRDVFISSVAIDPHLQSIRI